MKLSRLTLDTRSRQARRDLSNPYEMHRTLTRAFAEDGAASPRFLWRLEVSVARWSRPQVLVQCGQTPGWERLGVERGYFADAPEDREVDFRSLVVRGRALRFRLRANPTHSVARKRRALLSEPEQRDWLARQGQQHGFSIDAALVSDTSGMRMHLPEPRRPIQFAQVQFDGVLTVTDDVALCAAAALGIGRAKAFGCGLLSLAPA